jgi:hypothetical protein
MDRPYKAGVPHYCLDWMSPEEWVAQGHLRGNECLQVMMIMDDVVRHLSESRRPNDLEWRRALWCIEAACITDDGQ